jgi:hypothetical protein
MEFVEAFREKMPMFRGFIVDCNFGACSNIATDLLRASEFAKYPEGVFIGEVLEQMFFELKRLTQKYETKKEDLEIIQKVSYPLIDFIEANIPLTDTDKKAEFYTLLMNARYVATEKQIKYFRENKPKPIPPRFPMISDEEDEE